MFDSILSSATAATTISLSDAILTLTHTSQEKNACNPLWINTCVA